MSRTDTAGSAPCPYSARSAAMKPSAIREILRCTEMPEVISFAGGLPAPELFPREDLAAAAAAVFADDGPAALQYGPTQGYGPLRAWVCDYLARSVELKAEPEQVLITGGSQQGLDLVAKIFLDPGDVVLAENPAYVGALQAFGAYQARVVGLPADGEGMDPVRLRAYLAHARRRPKLLYLVTNFQNPTGTSTSAARRRELAQVAAEHGVRIVEDDPYGSLRYEGPSTPTLTSPAPVGPTLTSPTPVSPARAVPAVAAPPLAVPMLPVPALASLPGAEHSLYLGTASKLLAPGLRVAWLVAPDPVTMSRLVVAKQAADLHTASFTQRVVERYLRGPGRLDAHVARLRQAYGERRDAMLAALEREFPGGAATWTRPAGGLFLWVRLARRCNATQLLPAAIERKVAYVPGASFWTARADHSTLRLNFSNAAPERIAEGIRRLGQAIAAAA